MKRIIPFFIVIVAMLTLSQLYREEPQGLEFGIAATIALGALVFSLQKLKTSVWRRLAFASLVGLAFGYAVHNARSTDGVIFTALYWCIAYVAMGNMYIRRKYWTVWGTVWGLVGGLGLFAILVFATGHIWLASSLGGLTYAGLYWAIQEREYAILSDRAMRR